MRRRIGLLLMVGGVMLAVLTALLVSGISQRQRDAAAQVEMKRVVVATANIATGQVINEEMLGTRAYAAEAIPEGAVGSVEEVVNSFARTSIVEGQLITGILISSEKNKASLLDNIPAGKVGCAIPKTDVMSLNNLILVGNRVDVIATLQFDEQRRDDEDETERPSSQTVLQNVRVIHVAGGEGDGGAVVLECDHQQAVQLGLLKASGSVLDVTLRGAADKGEVVATDGATLNSEAVRSKFPIPEQLEP